MVTASRMPRARVPQAGRAIGIPRGSEALREPEEPARVARSRVRWRRGVPVERGRLGTRGLTLHSDAAEPRAKRPRAHDLPLKIAAFWLVRDRHDSTKFRRHAVSHVRDRVRWPRYRDRAQRARARRALRRHRSDEGPLTQRWRHPAL